MTLKSVSTLHEIATFHRITHIADSDDDFYVVFRCVTIEDSSFDIV